MSLHPGEFVISESPVCQILLLDDTDSLQQCVGIQKLTWGYPLEDLWPSGRLWLCREIGGQVLRAVSQTGNTWLSQ